MKQLILLRHAKSSWGDAALDDHDRPLSSRGEIDAPRMAERIANRVQLAGSLILCSTALRARQTADALTNAVGDDLNLIHDPRLYLATPGTVHAVIAEQADDAGAVVVVGHNPGLTELSQLLLPALSLQNLPTGGVVGMHLPMERWSELGTIAGEFDFFDYPKKTGA